MQGCRHCDNGNYTEVTVIRVSTVTSGSQPASLLTQTSNPVPVTFSSPIQVTEIMTHLFLYGIMQTILMLFGNIIQINVNLYILETNQIKFKT